VINLTTFLFISGQEIVVILVIVLLIFGTDKLPEIARGLGKGMRTLKDASNDIKSEITKSAENHGLDKRMKSLKRLKMNLKTLQVQ